MDGEHLNPQGGAPARDVSARQDFTLFARLHEIGRGRYRVLQPMHAGARGDLYHGQENESGAAIVVRAMVVDAAEAPELLRRVTEQVAIARRVEHPAAVVPSQPESAGGVVAYTEPLAAGSVEAILAERRVLDTKEIFRILDRAAEVLDHAHARSIVHGRVKPGNLLLDSRGEVTVDDFGVAIAESEPRSARGLARRAASAYDAPEQWRGHHPGYRSDQYSLAVIAYELLTGERRLDAPTVEGIPTLAPLEVSSFTPLRPGLSLQANLAMRTALSSGPENRFATVREFTDALAGRGPRSSKGLPTSRARVSLIKRHHLAGVGGVLVGVALAMIALDEGTRSSVEHAGRSLRHVLARGPSVESPASGLGTGGGGGGGSGRAPVGYSPGDGSVGSATPGSNGPAPDRGVQASPSSGASGTQAVTFAPTGGRTEPSTSHTTTTIGTGTAAGRRASGGGGASASGAVRGANDAAAKLPGYATAASAGARVMAWMKGAGSSAAAADTRGFISVSANGGSAVVVVDGLPRGTTPTVVGVDSGRHSVSLHAVGQSFTPAEAIVSVRAKETVAASFRAAKP